MRQKNSAKSPQTVSWASEKTFLLNFFSFACILCSSCFSIYFICQTLCVLFRLVCPIPSSFSSAASPFRTKSKNIWRTLVNIKKISEKLSVFINRISGSSVEFFLLSLISFVSLYRMFFHISRVFHKFSWRWKTRSENILIQEFAQKFLE